MLELTDENTIRITYSEITRGFPVIDDDAFQTGLTTALEGGDATETFFANLNETAAFWAAIADGTISFIPATDPEANPVVIASDGNVDMRIAARHMGGGQPFGVIAIELGNTATRLQQVMAFEIDVTSAPELVPIGEELFNGLLPAIYRTFSDLIGSMAGTLAKASSVQDPRINPKTLIVTILTAASSKAVSVAGALTQWGLSYLVANFNKLAFSMGAVVPLMAIPLLFGYLAHAMFTTVMVVNQTDFDITVQVDKQVHGATSVEWPLSTLPGQSAITFPVIGGDSNRLTQTALSQYINVNTLGSIGLVLSTSRKGGSTATEVIAVPWSGTNTIWAGEPTTTPDASYNAHSSANGQLAYRYNSDDFTVRMAISKLQGKTSGVYWYGVLIALQPAT